MELRTVSERLSASAQLMPADMGALKARGFKAVIINRPDGEGADQPSHQEVLAAAEAAGLEGRYLPITPGKMSDADVAGFAEAMENLPGPVVAFCRTGMRSVSLWALAEVQAGASARQTRERAEAAGYDLSGLDARLSAAEAAQRAVAERAQSPTAERHHAVLIIGGGAAGIAVAASLRARARHLDVAIIDPAETHYYQPGWTMVGAGVFTPEVTARRMAALIPGGVSWIREAVTGFEPDENAVILEGCGRIRYDRLIVCPGLKLDWGAIPGLSETLGKNGVTSNYRYDLAPYTWDLVQKMRSGRALFTQPPMPIKCAGAPQKAMYLSASDWERRGVLKDVEIGFYNAGPVLFGVKDYVPALMRYVERYCIDLQFNNRLVEIDGPGQMAVFERSHEGGVERVRESFDMIHVVPPQTAPDMIRASPLADAAGWVDVDPITLKHVRYDNIWALGDAASTPNAKTAAAVRKQAPVVAANIVSDIEGLGPRAAYDGYGSCPLTVEKGRIVLAEFGYGGVLQPSFPTWLLDGTKPSKLAWFLKERLLPPIYWQAMLRGREWLAKPEAPTSTH